MIQCVVIADDLTGANATGAMLKKLGLKTFSMMDLSRIEPKALDDYDVVTYSTYSRSINADEAYDRVYEAAKLLKSNSVKLYNKRIDSTLRGNLGSEIDGILNGLGNDRIAVVVPAFPQAGRIAVGGYLLVNGIMLQKTDAAQDPRNPITSSIIEDFILKQTAYKVKSISLDTVYSGIESIKKEIQNAVSEGNRIVVIDALQVEDLDIIADAVIGSGVKFVAVDPGPFTASVTGKLLANENSSEEEKILMSVGSVTNLTRIQIEELQRSYKMHLVDVCSSKLIDNEALREQEIRRVVQEILASREQYNLFCVATDAIYPENRLDLDKLAQQMNATEQELSLRINDGIAEISYRILKEIPEIEGIFSSGGDITVAVCSRLKAYGMKLITEVFPLVAYGKLEGGEYPGLRLVTKGGMVGDKDGMKICIQFMKEQLNANHAGKSK
ncbi:MAG: four-carbon acid sugar kinase family protein [Caulobacteraceae bacterium]